VDNLAIISTFSSILSITSICGLAFFSHSLNAAGAIDSVSLFQGPVRRKEARGVFLTKTAKSQFVSKNSDLSPVPRRPYRGLPPRD
jgi:hypothetical protein